MRPRGSPEGHRPNGRSLRVSRAPKGESRGAPPQWQEVWRMCLHKPSSLFFPLPLRKGARGMGERTAGGYPEGHPYGGGGCPEGHPVWRTPKGESRGAPPQWQESEGVPRAPKGESRGAPPQWQEVWRMCLHKPPSSLFFPLPLRKGARGMVRPDGRWVPTRGTPRWWVCRAPKGESRGAQPLWQESEGVPQPPLRLADGEEVLDLGLDPVGEVVGAGDFP